MTKVEFYIKQNNTLCGEIIIIMVCDIFGIVTHSWNLNFFGLFVISRPVYGSACWDMHAHSAMEDALCCCCCVAQRFRTGPWASHHAALTLHYIVTPLCGLLQLKRELPCRCVRFLKKIWLDSSNQDCARHCCARFFSQNAVSYWA